MCTHTLYNCRTGVEEAPSAAAADSADGKLPGGSYNYTDVLFKSLIFFEVCASCSWKQNQGGLWGVR